MSVKIIGKIVNTFQLKGKVKVTLNTDFPEDRFKVGNTIYIDVDGVDKKEFKINSYMLLNPKVVAISFDGYNDINDVEFLINKDIYADVEIAKDSYFYDDLLQMDVYTSTDNLVGRVNKIIKMKNIDYLIVNNLYIPFQIDKFIDRVDVSNKKIILTSLGDEVTR